MMILMKSKEWRLKKKIECFRKEMIQIGIKEGLTSEKVVGISQQLDMYIAKYQSLKCYKE